MPRRAATTLSLDRFVGMPLELVTEILLMLSVYSLLSLREAHPFLRVLVDSLPQYKFVQHASILEKMMTLQVAAHFDIIDVFTTLCDHACFVCGCFGGFLWMPECKRVCFLCLSVHPRLLILTSTWAVTTRRWPVPLTLRQLKEAMPILRTEPSIIRTNGRRQHSIVSAEAVKKLVVDRCAANGTARALADQTVNGIVANGPFGQNFGWDYRWMSVLPLPHIDRANPRQSVVASTCKGCQAAHELRIARSRNHLEPFRSRGMILHDDLFDHHSSHCGNPLINRGYHIDYLQAFALHRFSRM